MLEGSVLDIIRGPISQKPNLETILKGISSMEIGLGGAPL